MEGLNGGRINIGACSLGGAQAALDKAMAYIADRKAFGEPHRRFQALQFQLADMATGAGGGADAALARGRRAGSGEPRSDRAVRDGQAVRDGHRFEVANEALQLHGGYGYLDDYGIEKIVRDLRVHQILEGTNEIMRLIIARGLMEQRG